jgi:hypothetical protein
MVCNATARENCDMSRVVRLALAVLVALIAFESLVGPSVLLADTPEGGRSANQAQIEKHMRDGQLAEALGYILGGAGIILILAYIPVAIYQDRKKKARKRNAPQAPGATP